ncbi:hypothetical protein [Mangrovibacterium diazotrophicum]|nr:hypothetical protein [Mangrovibacterium diazotrophicum]
MKLFGVYLSVLLFISSCEEKKGCTDPNSLNYDFEAEASDGSCNYSTTTFYAKYGYFDGIPIVKVDVSVNGSNIGSINAVYPSGPGNCSAVGTIAYEFQSGESVDWNSEIVLANGAVLYSSGIVSPSSSSACIKVNVTR